MADIATRTSMVIERCFACEPGEVRPDARLTADLAAESIDFLDLGFMLEREFDIRVPRDSFAPQALGDVARSRSGPSGQSAAILGS